MTPTKIESFAPAPEDIDRLSPVAAHTILAAFPEHIRSRSVSYAQSAFERRAQEIDYPVEAVLEMAISGFLDREALSFGDCQPRY
jgi:hypothetical protein